MNYKKLVLSLAALLCLGLSAFAEIAIKDLGKDGVTITFTFKDPSSEMGVIGSFDNWTVPGEPMTKNAAGLWEVTIKASATDEIVYKFYSKGTWIPDEMAPDHKDDGYGGKNGLIVVADILSGAIPAVPGAAPVVVAAGAKKPAGRPKMAWGTVTWVESDTAFNVDSGKFDVQNSLINAYSQWKFQGDLIAGMPGHIEVTAFKGQPKVYDSGTVVGSTALDAGTGMQNLAGGALFSPFYYLGGNKDRPVIDQFAFGVDNPYLVYNTGYGNAPFPGHRALVWDTVTQAAEVKYGSTHRGTVSTVLEPRTSKTALLAGNGYSSFVLGPKARDLGEVTLDAGLVPNYTLNNNSFGLMTWFSAAYAGITAEVQYEMVSALNADGSAKSDVTQFFKEPAQQNTILGLEALVLDGFLVRGDVILPKFPLGTTKERLALDKKIAYKAVVGFEDVYKDSQYLFGYSYRGGTVDNLDGSTVTTAQLLYLTQSDNNSILGAPSTQVVSASGYQKFGYWGNAKWLATASLPAVMKSESNMALDLKPGFVLDFSKLEIAPVSVEVLSDVLVNTKPEAGAEATSLAAIGAKISFSDPIPGVVSALDLYYKLDNSVKNALNTTVLSEAKLSPESTLQAGVGYRSGSATKNALGLSVGANYTVPSPEFKTPVLYCQFVYNMDPYNYGNSAGAIGYDLSDFGPTNGVAAYDGAAALRAGIEWNF